MNSIIYTPEETQKDLLFNESAFDANQMDTFNGKIGIKDRSITNDKIAENASISQSKVSGLSDTISLLNNKVNGFLTQGIWRKTFATYQELVDTYPNLEVDQWNNGDYVEVVADETADTSLHTAGAASTYSVVNNKLVFRRDIPTTVGTATSGTLGVVMAGTDNGEVQVDTDGKMSVIGYTTINDSVQALTEETNTLKTNLNGIASATLTVTNTLASRIDGITVSSLGAATAEQGAKADTAIQSVGLRKANASDLILTVDGVDQPTVSLLLGTMAYANTNDYIRTDSTTGPVAELAAEQQEILKQQQATTESITALNTATNKLNSDITSINDTTKTLGETTAKLSTELTNVETLASATAHDLSTATARIDTSISGINTSVTSINTAITNINKNSSEGDWGEMDTGRTFRGKKIYRQDFTLYINADANYTANFVLINTANYVDAIISQGGYWMIGYNHEARAIPGGDANNGFVLISDTGYLTFRSTANNKRTSATAIIIVEYTKK